MFEQATPIEVAQREYSPQSKNKDRQGKERGGCRGHGCRHFVSFCEPPKILSGEDGAPQRHQKCLLEKDDRLYRGNYFSFYRLYTIEGDQSVPGVIGSL